MRGVTAVDLMLQTRTKTWSPQEWKQVVFAPSTTSPPFGIGDVESDFDWSRPPTSEEGQRRYLHAYDRGGSYVAGIAGLELPIGDPVHHPDGAAFDAKTPGYWLVEIPEAADWRLPYVLNPRGLGSPGPSGTTPTLDGRSRSAIDRRSWRPGRGRARPRPAGWYERFRDACARWTSTIPTLRPRAIRRRSSVPTASASSAPMSTSRVRPPTAPNGGCMCSPRPRPRRLPAYADRGEDRAVAAGGGHRHRRLRLR